MSYLVFMVQQPLILFANVNLATMEPTAVQCVPTEAVTAGTENVTVDSKGGEENFVRREDAQGL